MKPTIFLRYSYHFCYRCLIPSRPTDVFVFLLVTAKAKPLFAVVDLLGSCDAVKLLSSPFGQRCEQVILPHFFRTTTGKPRKIMGKPRKSLENHRKT